MIARCSAVPMYLRIPKRVGRVLALASAATIVLFAALVPQPVAALEILQSIGQILGAIITFFVWIVGKLLILAIYVLTTIAQYNDFINAPAIVKGWVIVRDVANMFFIVVLLVIAFATILNLSSYKYQQMLPKLLIAAILINFSRTICGIFIDLAQVVMLTFVNGFAAAAAGNFSSMFQMQNMFSIEPTETVTQAGVQMMMIVGGYLLALIMSLIALATVVVFIAILGFRIVMLWALVVLSPLPYLLRVMESRTKKYGDKWWDEFFNYLIVGPVLAFFLWLSLVTMGSGNGAEEANIGKIDESSSELQAKGFNEIGTKAGNANNMLSFIISIAMLMAGLKVTSELGVAGASMAGGLKNKVGEYGKTALKKGAYYGSGAAAGRSVLARGVQSKTFQKGLGQVAAARIPLASSWATSGLGAIQTARKKREEAAKQRIETVKKAAGLTALQRTVEPRTKVGKFVASLSASGHLEREEAKKMLPSAVKDVGARRKLVHGMAAKDVSELDVGEKRRLAALSVEEGGLTETQRLHIMQHGSISDQQAVGLPQGEKSYGAWKKRQEDTKYEALLQQAQVGGRIVSKDEKTKLQRQARREVEGMTPQRPTLLQGLTDASQPEYMPGQTIKSVQLKGGPSTNEDMYRVTADRVRAAEANTDPNQRNFFTSKEYKDNKQHYYDQQTFNEVRKTKMDDRKRRDAEGRNSVSGVERLREQHASTPTGASLGTARLVVDFGSIPAFKAIRDAGSSDEEMTGARKVAAANDIGDAMLREGYEQKEIDEVKDAVTRAGALRISDVGREETDRVRTVAQESAHDQLSDIAGTRDADLDALLDSLRSGPTDTRNQEELKTFLARAIANKATGQTGGPQLQPADVHTLRLLGFNFHKLFRIMKPSERKMG